MTIGTMQDLLHVEENFEKKSTKSTLKVLGKLRVGFLVLLENLNGLGLVEVGL
jgi:hypothetical protein